MPTIFIYDSTSHLVYVCAFRSSLSSGKERHGESGLDYFAARYYGSTMGVVHEPGDWCAKAEPVPYSSLSNPQTLNLYAYVGNNPLTGPGARWSCPD